MDSEVKRQLDEFCLQVGMNTTVAFNMFARAVLREGRLPFDVAVNFDPFYSGLNQRILQKSIAEIEAGEGKTYNDVSEVLADRP